MNLIETGFLKIIQGCTVIAHRNKVDAFILDDSVSN